MLLDVRTYRVKPNHIKDQFELYAKYGKPAQLRHLGPPLAFLRTETGDVNEYLHIWVYESAALRTETGDVNEYLHIWVYESAADREKKRAAMQADPDWQDYLKRSKELGALVSQSNRLMTPVDFFDKPKL